MSNHGFVAAMSKMLLGDDENGGKVKSDGPEGYFDSRKPKILKTLEVPPKDHGGTEALCARCLTCLSEIVIEYGDAQGHDKLNMLHSTDLQVVKEVGTELPSGESSPMEGTTNQGKCVLCAKLVQLFEAARAHVAFETSLRQTPYSQWSLVWTLNGADPYMNKTFNENVPHEFALVMLTVQHADGYGWGIGSFKLYPDNNQDTDETQGVSEDDMPTIAPLDGDRELYSSTLSQGSTTQIASWMTACFSTHGKCARLLTGLDGKGQERPYWVPDRLLELRMEPSKDSSAEELKGRIVATKASPESPSGVLPAGTKYLSLSHCWGPPPDPAAKIGGRSTTVLTEDKYEAWQQDLPLDSLPLTFQHAIQVSAALGFAYIWIDSLCIIQDSFADWEQQSAVMGDVYKYAFLNIAALSSVSDYDGFINWNRDTRVIFGFRAPLATLFGCDTEALDGKGRQSVLLKDQAKLIWTFESNIPGSNASNAPLFSRGWVYQERALAKRLLAFTDQGVYWQCDEVSHSEQPGYGGIEYQGLRWTLNARFDSILELGKKLKEQDLTTQQKLQLFQEYKDSTLRSYDMRWYTTVMMYTLCALTKQTDKLIAISSVARELSDETMWKYRYLAGLWDINLPYQMSWINVEGASTPKRKVAGEEGYVAPSWSWASIESKVQPRFMFYGRSHKALADATFADTSLVSDFRFGSVKAGWLRMRGHLRKFRIVGEQLVGNVSKPFVSDEQSGDNFWITPDTVECIEECRRLHDFFQRVGFPQEQHMAHLRWLPLVLQANDDILRCTCLLLMEVDVFAAMVEDKAGFVKEEDKVYRRLGTGEFSIKASLLTSDQLGLMRSLGTWPQTDSSTVQAQGLIEGFEKREADFTEFVLV